MTRARLADLYSGYIDCLNRQAWGELGRFVDEAVVRNGEPLGLSGYRAMLVKNFEDIPDLHFTIDLLVCEPPHVAARLAFRCTPRGEFMGLNVDGRTISFAENVFYEYANGKIIRVWSVIDKAAIEAQLGNSLT